MRREKKEKSIASPPSTPRPAREKRQENGEEEEWRGGQTFRSPSFHCTIDPKMHQLSVCSVVKKTNK